MCATATGRTRITLIRIRASHTLIRIRGTIPAGGEASNTINTSTTSIGGTVTDVALHKINFDPNPLQKQFIESQAEADIFMGRMGEGKSAALAWSCFYHTRHNPGADWAFVRDTWENLRATTLKEFTCWFPPGVAGTWNEGKKTFTWAEGLAKGTVEFLGMDDPQDAAKLQSRALAGVAIDEPAPAMQSGGVPETIFDIALTRLRQKRPDGAPHAWYSMKLATNSPDEEHWTYKRFVDPGEEGFRYWQSPVPENIRNLPEGYYERIRRHLGHRKDLVERFVEGGFGLMQEGIAVTPEWSDKLHLATGLSPVRGGGLVLCWDFGLNPTCIITQVTPMRDWLILHAFVGEEIGAEELIAQEVRPTLQAKYKGLPFRHIGDPNGKMREPSSSARSAVLTIRRELGGTFRAGPVAFTERREPLRAILSRQRGGRGIVQVDRTYAKPVWLALRGGWHFHVAKSGVPGTEPLKNLASHPGDALGYGAAILFPLGRVIQQGRLRPPQHASFFGSGPVRMRLPPEARSIL